MKDDRDLTMALAPHHDCARRLGADVAAFFRRVEDTLEQLRRAGILDEDHFE